MALPSLLQRKEDAGEMQQKAIAKTDQERKDLRR